LALQTSFDLLGSVFVLFFWLPYFREHSTYNMDPSRCV